MKKFLEKLTSPRKKPDVYLGFSGTSLKWAYSHGKTDAAGRIIIDDYGTISHFDTLSKQQLPKNFKDAISGSTVHFVLPAAVCHQMLVSEQISMDQVRAYAPGYVVQQHVLTAGTANTLYATTSIHMTGIAPQLEVLARKSIVPAQVQHVSNGFTHRDNGMDNPATFVVSLGETYCWVAWISGGHVLYQQDIAVGRSNLIQKLAETLKITETEAKKILDKYGVTRSHPDSTVLSALYQTLSPLAGLINTWIIEHSHFTYVKQPFQSVPGLIHILGSASDIVGIEQYFVLQTGIATENLKKKVLEGYVTKSEGHISGLFEYEPLVYMIEKAL